MASAVITGGRRSGRTQQTFGGLQDYITSGNYLQKNDRLSHEEAQIKTVAEFEALLRTILSYPAQTRPQTLFAVPPNVSLTLTWENIVEAMNGKFGPPPPIYPEIEAAKTLLGQIQGL